MHNWALYEEKCREERNQWLRGLTHEESLEIFASLHEVASSQRDDSLGWQRLEQKRWQEKIAIRRKIMGLPVECENQECSPSVDRA